VIETIRNYLISEGITETIYIGFRPAQPDTCITLYETAGLAPDAKYQYNTTGMQVFIRAREYSAARELAYSVYNKLQSLSKGNSTLDNVTQVLAVQDPYALGYDELQRAQFVQNYVIEYYLELENRN
jgi:hypothetical protein